MATKKIEELTIDQLKKKNKDSTTLIAICSTVIIICLLLMIYSIIADVEHTSILGASCLGLFVVMLPIVAGRKKIREELKKREFAQKAG